MSNPHPRDVLDWFRKSEKHKDLLREIRKLRGMTLADQIELLFYMQQDSSNALMNLSNQLGGELEVGDDDIKSDQGSGDLQ